MKYILIDLDGTLLDFKKGERKSIINTLNNVGYNPTEKEIKLFSDINEEEFEKYKINLKTRPEFHHDRFKRLKDKLNIDYDIDETNKYYVKELKYSSETFDDIFDSLKYLSNKYDLFVASNGMCEVQLKRMELAGLDKYFKKSFISEECGANKPDIKFFEYIFNDLNDHDKSNYIIVGDRLDTDILGGINAGIKTIYINRNNINNEISPDYEIIDFNELKNIL
jgi:YjjG family noncanonical pyrimidine nucleotidase